MQIPKKNEYNTDSRIEIADKISDTNNDNNTNTRTDFEWNTDEKRYKTAVIIYLIVILLFGFFFTFFYAKNAHAEGIQWQPTISENQYGYTIHTDCEDINKATTDQYYGFEMYRAEYPTATPRIVSNQISGGYCSGLLAQNNSQRMQDGWWNLGASTPDGDYWVRITFTASGGTAYWNDTWYYWKGTRTASVWYGEQSFEADDCWYETTQEDCENLPCEWKSLYGTEYCSPPGMVSTGDICQDTTWGCQFCNTQELCTATGMDNCSWNDNQCIYDSGTACTAEEPWKCLTEDECINTASGLWYDNFCRKSVVEYTEANFLDQAKELLTDPNGFIGGIIDTFNFLEKPPFSWIISIKDTVTNELNKINDETYTASSTIYAENWGDVTVNLPAQMGTATNLTFRIIDLETVKNDYSTTFSTFRNIIDVGLWIGFVIWLFV